MFPCDRPYARLFISFFTFVAHINTSRFKSGSSISSLSFLHFNKTLKCLLKALFPNVRTAVTSLIYS